MIPSWPVRIAEHIRLADLLRARLDHQHGLVRAGNRQAQLGNRALLLIRVDDDFAVHQTDGNAADRACPRISLTAIAAEAPIIAGISGGTSCSTESTVATTCTSLRMPLVEQRAQRAVDQAGGQRRLFGRTTLALDETAGDLAHGIHLSSKSTLSGKKSDLRAACRSPSR